jgi:hypothetical protein
VTSTPGYEPDTIVTHRPGTRVIEHVPGQGNIFLVRTTYGIHYVKKWGQEFLPLDNMKKMKISIIVEAIIGGDKK